MRFKMPDDLIDGKSTLVQIMPLINKPWPEPVLAKIFQHHMESISHKELTII